MVKNLKTLKLIAGLTLLVAIGATILPLTGCPEPGTGGSTPKEEPKKPYEIDDEGLIYNALPGDPVYDNMSRTGG